MSHPQSGFDAHLATLISWCRGMKDSVFRLFKEMGLLPSDAQALFNQHPLGGM
jgi:hypothetical protein